MSNSIDRLNLFQVKVNKLPQQRQFVELTTQQNPSINTELGGDTFTRYSELMGLNSNATTPFRNQYLPRQLLRAYADKAFVQRTIESNPELQKIIKKYDLNEINTKNVLGILNSHLSTTNDYARTIANNMGNSVPEKQLLDQACLFHDFGKMLIPNEIINKPGKLNPYEKEVMDLHAELGYQLLSQTGLNERVLNMVRNHHKPEAENPDILGRILSVADIYSALREPRVYKKPLSEVEALNILDQKASSGEVSTEVLNVLKSSIYSAKSA